MSKISFKTRYDRDPQARSVVDQHDNVDRLSYVDSTEMVKRMIYEGQNLSLHRAQALKSGMYSLQDLKEDDKTTPMPVYDQDPVVQHSLIEEYQAELNNRQSGEIVPDPVVSEQKEVSGSESANSGE